MGSNPWPYIGVIILVAAGAIILLSAVISFVVLALSRKAAVKVVDKHVRGIEKQLPGKNCGQCGCETCEAYAEAVLYRDVRTPCPYCDEEKSKELEACADAFWKLTEDPTPPKKKRSWFNRFGRRDDDWPEK